MTIRRAHASTLLLFTAPIAIALDWYAPERHTWIFFASVIAILPLAWYIGRATEQLADRFGGGIGGLLNATFGNITELIIGAFALRAGLVDLVKASLTGSIIGNVLLVFGLCALVGGLRHPVQRFNRTAAGLGATMLLLSAIALIVPAVFHHLSQRDHTPELRLETAIAGVLLVTYCASLVFTLKTHRHIAGLPTHAKGTRGDYWPAMLMLLASTAAVAWMSELLVGAVSSAAQSLGMSQLFVGVVVLAIVGNAAEHYSAVVMARQNKMDAAIAIAIGSSTQIALFVAPILVFLSYAIAPIPMDLRFTIFEVVAIGLAVLTIAMIAHDGETHWMEGVQLLAVYAVLVLGFYYLPVP
jgi:Ca2+:H+ antiporter